MLTRRSLLGLAGALAGTSTLAVWLAPTLTACDSGQNDRSADRGPVLTQVTDQVIAPAFAQVRTTAEALPAALDALASGPTAATLTAARTAWNDARGAFRRTSAFSVVGSPSDDISVTSGILDQPAEAEKVEALAASTTPVDPRTQPASVRGFLAIEYLLFDPARDDAAMVASFTGDAGAGRAALAKVLASDLRDRLVATADGWLTGGFLDQMRTAGKGSENYLSQKSAFDALLNQMVSTLSRLFDIVRHSAGIPDTNPKLKIPTTDRSDRTLTDLLDDLTSLASLYGSGPTTISSIVLEVDPDADRATQAALADVRAALTGFTPPLRGSITDRSAAVDDLIKRMRVLKAAVAIQVFQALGTSASFTDKDGD